MNFVKFDDWSTLEGVVVEIWRGGSLVRRCLIDAATKDSSVVWSAADGNNPRRLWDKNENFEVRVPVVFKQRAEAKEGLGSGAKRAAVTKQAGRRQEPVAPEEDSLSAEGRMRKGPHRFSAT